VIRVQAAQAAAVAGLLALSGCSGLSSPFASKPAAPCPDAVILRPLANTAVFGPLPQQIPQNVAFYGLLSEVDRTCEYTGDAVRMNLDVIVIGQRGPAAKGNDVDLNYFVAITGPDRQILSKKPFAVRVVFDPDQIRAGVTDHIVETIPLDGHKGTDLDVVLGFQQSPQAVDFYKHFRGR
jgi:hypothetical protein